MTRLTFPIARRYDTKYLLDGTVGVDGFDIEFIETGGAPWPYFRDMMDGLSYDIGEQAFSHYLIARDRGKKLTAIPVFPSRFFPQAGARIHTGAGIDTPADLVGKRVAVTGFGFNPAAWLRGILTHHYNVPTEKIIWVDDPADPFLTALADAATARYTIERDLAFENEPDDPGHTWGLQLLEEGKIDALISPAGGPRITEHTKPLFDDPVPEIRGYVERTGVHPINTVIVLKTETVDANPALPAALMAAFTEAKSRYNAEVEGDDGADHMGLTIGALKSLGVFPNGYGLDGNRAAIRMMLAYCFEQGLIGAPLTPEDVFLDV